MIQSSHRFQKCNRNSGCRFCRMVCPYLGGIYKFIYSHHLELVKSVDGNHRSWLSVDLYWNTWKRINQRDWNCESPHTTLLQQQQQQQKQQRIGLWVVQHYEGGSVLLKQTHIKSSNTWFASLRINICLISNFSNNLSWVDLSRENPLRFLCRFLVPKLSTTKNLDDNSRTWAKNRWIDKIEKLVSFRRWCSWRRYMFWALDTIVASQIHLQLDLLTAQLSI